MNSWARKSDKIRKGKPPQERGGLLWLAPIAPRGQPRHLGNVKRGNLRWDTGGHNTVVLDSNDITRAKLPGNGRIDDHSLPRIKIKYDQTVAFCANDDGVHSHSYHPNSILQNMSRRGDWEPNMLLAGERERHATARYRMR